jgi:ATP-dependent exoDNAse (exonuclease V) alpha subunit
MSPSPETSPKSSKCQKNAIDLQMIDATYEQRTSLEMRHESKAAEHSQSIEFAERMVKALEVAKEISKTESLPSEAPQAIEDLLNAPAIMVLVRRIYAGATTATGVEHGLG